MTHILVVDDDPAVRRGVATLLEQAGFTTQELGRGADVLARLGEPPVPALVILDVMMPGLDGYTVCRHIRRLPVYIPILMLSARDELTDKITGLELGADEYVTKPFEPRELLARVRAMLRFAEARGGEQTPNEPLVRGTIRLWRGQHRVEVAGQLVELTPREWSLLELLMDHPGQVWGRETLLRRVWGDEWASDTRTVDVHIQRLRAKIETNPSAPHYIQTVRGFGYRFVET